MALAIHTWDLTPKEAVALQRELASRVNAQTPLADCELVAGADVSYNRFSPVMYVAVVVLRTSDWSVIEKQEIVGNASFPYVPGLLSFREAPLVLEAFARLKEKPQVLMVDGQGIAHPRRLGIASHLGLCLDLPTIGCAKSRLIGEAKEPGLKRGCSTILRDKGEAIGKMVRTRDGTRPLYISVGHRIDIASAVSLVLRAARGYRVPEPTRQAHLHVNELRRRALG